MEFPLEAGNGSFIYNIALDKMETEDSGDVQYVYDDSELIMGGNCDFNNITDVGLVLEDGTRAMIVNGTLVTADGQTLILQDGSDLSQYSVDDNTDEIVISKEQEDQFMQIMKSGGGQTNNQDLVHYVKDDGSDGAIKSKNSQQMLYIQEGQTIVPIQEQYQIAEFEPDFSKEPMRVLKFENEQILEEIDGVIDLDQLLLTEHGAAQLENGNYQYAVLKDGKFHLRTTNDTLDALETSVNESQGDDVVFDDSVLLNADDYFDLSTVKGRNVRTGQVITLSRSFDKYANKRLKSEVKTEPNAAPCNSNLKRLINKKITIGQTDTGKTLVGKIVNVMKKPDDTIKNMTISSNSRNVKKPVSKPIRRLKEASEIPVNKVVNLLDDEDINIISAKNANCSLNELIATTNKCQTPSMNLSKNCKQAQPILSKSSLTRKSVVSTKESKKPMKNFHPAKENPTKFVAENPSEYSKLIVHKKVVTKECFDVITKTLSGLMNMDSVVKKLRNRTLIIKIIEKTHNRDKKCYKWSSSYCSGYMVREYKLDDHDCSFSESWKFIPDANTMDTILGQNNVETVIQDGASGANGLKQFANLTIQITVNSEGNRTTRVIINPPALFQCKTCSKSFRTSALLKLHLKAYHTQPEVEYSLNLESKEATSSCQSEGKGGMYECMECNMRFQSPSQIRKHMNLHYSPSMCALCKLSLPSVIDLNQHMLTTHSELSTEPLKQEVAADKPAPRKVFSCHICSRQFSRHSNLQRHIEIHQGEGAMYQCAVCSCSYHYIASLTRHVVSCHVNKNAKKARLNVNDDQTSKQNVNDAQTNRQNANASQDQELQFLEDDQIVQMIPLEHITEESLQQYVAQNMEYVGQGFEETGNEVQILQIPMDSSIVLED